MRKRAELTSTQLITIIILIVSFAIILIFFFALNLRGQIDKESCKNSIVLRDTFSKIGIGALNLKGVVSLKCRSQDVCINLGGSCSGVRKDVMNVKINDMDKINSEIKELAEDCWSMVGAGEVKYGKNDECGICYIIYFDEEIKTIETNSLDIDFTLTNNQEIKESLSTENPIAVISFIGDWENKDSKIILSQFTSDDLKKNGCDDYLFV